MTHDGSIGAESTFICWCLDFLGRSTGRSRAAYQWRWKEIPANIVVLNVISARKTRDSTIYPLQEVPQARGPSGLPWRLITPHRGGADVPVRDRSCLFRAFRDDCGAARLRKDVKVVPRKRLSC